MANETENGRESENIISEGEAVENRPLASEPVPDPDEIDREGERQSKIAALPGRGIDSKRAIVLASVAAAVLVLGFGAIDAMRGDPTQDAEQAEEPDQGALANYDPASIIAPTLADAPNDPNAPVEVPALDGQQTGVARATTDGRPQKSEAQIIAEAQRRAGIMAFGGRTDSGGIGGALSGITGGGAQGSALGAPAMSQGDDSRPGGGRTTLDNLRNTSEITRVSGRSIGNRDMLILAGTFIPCVLQTAMDSSQPGYASCVIPRDVYSDNGRVVLLEKGTRVLGEYQAGISRGRYRLFVMWNRAVTPRGVAVDVGSPASDALGRAGIAGGVENYFWERFGAALLFSALDDGMDVLADSVTNADETTRAPSRASETILRDTTQIQPVLKVNQGAEVGIMVARDFDFSDIYGLQMRR
ncbi:type IV secretion system protein VirB10 [Novosphingobium sp. RD2P27]|uniref:Type IV secretion system protein VirB10 n=1 Tax=Novosphingobium kalidii TaxID=3230299 RepID=A0ABV2D3P9_9SPHN